MKLAASLLLVAAALAGAFDNRQSHARAPVPRGESPHVAAIPRNAVNLLSQRLNAPG